MIRHHVNCKWFQRAARGRLTPAVSLRDLHLSWPAHLTSGARRPTHPCTPAPTYLRSPPPILLTKLAAIILVSGHPQGSKRSRAHSTAGSAGSNNYTTINVYTRVTIRDTLNVLSHPLMVYRDVTIVCIACTIGNMEHITHIITQLKWWVECG